LDITNPTQKEIGFSSIKRLLSSVNNSHVIIVFAGGDGTLPTGLNEFEKR
jgi:NCAIR mutase (PurE)-related protein